MVLTYHPNLPSVAATLRTNWEVMTNQSQSLKRTFPSPPMVAYRRAKNLKDHLVRAKISSKRKSNRLKNGYGRCNQGCMLCVMSPTTKTPTHSCRRTRKTWKITAPIDCNTTDVVYKLRCRKHQDFLYIGETKRRFRDRISDHRSSIKQKKDNAIGRHFGTGHTWADLIPVAIERVLPKGNHQLRKARETFWINQHDSVEFGANTRD